MSLQRLTLDKYIDDLDFDEIIQTFSTLLKAYNVYEQYQNSQLLALSSTLPEIVAIILIRLHFLIDNYCNTKLLKLGIHSPLTSKQQNRFPMLTDIGLYAQIVKLPDTKATITGSRWLHTFCAEDRGFKGDLFTACQAGNLTLVKFIMNQKENEIDNSYTNIIMMSIFTLGFAFSPFKKSRGYMITERILNAAAQSGNVELLIYLFNYSSRKNLSQDTLQFAAMSGNIKMMSLLMEQGNEELNYVKLIPNEDTLLNAIHSGNVKLVEWMMHANRGDHQQTPRKEWLEYALNTKNTNMITYFEQELFLESSLNLNSI